MEYNFDDALRFAETLAKAPKVMEREMKSSATRIAIQGEGWTKEGTPVRTGTLRRSIAHQRGTFVGGVARSSWGTATPYAKPVEYGRGAIVAAPGKVLRFVPKGSRKAIYRKRVGPAAGAFMFRKATNRIRPLVPLEFRAAMRRVIAAIGGDA